VESKVIEIGFASPDDYQILLVVAEPESVLGNHKIYNQLSK